MSVIYLLNSVIRSAADYYLVYSVFLKLSVIVIAMGDVSGCPCTKFGRCLNRVNHRSGGYYGNGFEHLLTDNADNNKVINSSSKRRFFNLVFQCNTTPFCLLLLH